MTPVTAVPRPLRLRPLGVLLLGGALGFSLSRIGFTDYGELHRMFVFADMRMFLVFMGGVVLTGLGLLAIGAWRTLPPRALHRGTVVGGLLFGLGWALAGACPGVAFAQLGEGKLTALVTLAGILLGTLGFSALQRLVPARPDGDSCG